MFTRIKAPHRGLTSGGVTQAVAAAARRAGLGVIYAHRLRHSAATAMLAQGASLTEIGQVLRHRRPDHFGIHEDQHRGPARARPPLAGCVMTGLRETLAGYLDLRRSLGFKLERDEKLLGQFITHLEQRGTGTITVTDALASGHAARRRQPGLAADAAHRGARFRPLPGHPRPRGRGSPGRPAARPTARPSPTCTPPRRSPR